LQTPAAGPTCAPEAPVDSHFSAENRFRTLPTQARPAAIDSRDASRQGMARPPRISKDTHVAKPDLGTKRICPVTGRKFYDLNQSPVISPYTGEVVPIDVPVTRGRPESAAARAAAAKASEEAEAPETQDAEFVSLEEADAESSGKKDGAAPDADEEDVEIADEEDDSTFLEEAEDENEDVSDIIGGDIENEEET
jgi:uncharacterized protein (TIGR02300 family)